MNGEGREAAVPGRDWLERLPKVELHLHLEGAIPPEALWQLIEKYGGDASVPTLADLPGRFVYRDFPHFIETWIWKQGFLREPDDLELISEAFARELARQRIVYAEVFFSPSDLYRFGLTAAEVAVAMRRGLDRVEGTEVALIVDVERDKGPEFSGRTLENVAEVAREVGLIGITIGGPERLFPPEPYAGDYERARELGLHTTAHAGEDAGPESVWGAIRALLVERIGHGTRAVEDPDLVSYLAERRIPLESCPGSNVCTGIVPSIAAHPFRKLYDAGVLVTVNSDDPAMFGLTLAGEYEALQREHGFTDDQVRGLVLNGIEASWLPPERKREMRRAFEADPDWAG